MKSLIKGGYKGTIHPINTGAQEIWALPAYPSIAEIDDGLDLAVIVLPAKLIKGIFEECVEKDVKGIVLITAGFKEIDDPIGGELQKELKKLANEAAIPVIGPNTFGSVNINNDLNASFTPEFSRLKKGKAEIGNQASLSHTGSMAGQHEIYRGALKQSGVYCLDSTESMLDTARALADCPLQKNRRVAILSGQAGPGMAACDVCESDGLEVTAFSPQTQDTINELLPPLALRTNPVDMGPAWYSAAATSGIVRAVMEDDHIDGILMLMMFASANREAVSALKEVFLEWKQKNRSSPASSLLPASGMNRFLNLKTPGP